MSRQDIEIGTSERHTLSVYSHDDEACVQLLGVDPWGDVQSITFPREKAPAVIAALQAVVDAEAAS